MQHHRPTGRSSGARPRERTADKDSRPLPDLQLGAPALTFEEILGEPTPKHLRRFLFRSQASTDVPERRVMLSLATELLEDIESRSDIPTSLLADLRAELALTRALVDLAEDRLTEARGQLRSALGSAEQGSGDVVLLGQIHETVAQLAWIADGPTEAVLRLRPALDLYRQAEQQPELASALFRAAAWRLAAGQRGLGLEHVRAALDTLELDALLADDRAGAWEVLRRCVGTTERAAGLWAPLGFAVEHELAAVGLAEPHRRRVQGEAWALAALATLERGGDATSAGKMLTRAERCLLRDTTVSVQRLESVAVAFRHLLCEPEQPAPTAEALAWASAVLAAFAEPDRSPASLWSPAVAEGDPNRCVFDTGTSS